MMTAEWPKGRIRRWAMRLMQLDCEIQYRRGTTQYIADALSRAPLVASHDDADSNSRLVDDLLLIQDIETESANGNPFGKLIFEGDRVATLNTVAVVTDSQDATSTDLGDRDMWIAAQKCDPNLMLIRSKIVQDGGYKNETIVIEKDGLMVQHFARGESFEEGGVCSEWKI